MLLLSYAEFGPNNEIAEAQLATGTKILTQFLMIFRSFLSNKNPFSTLMSQRDLFDANESAYQWMYSLFKPGEQVRNVMTRNSSIRSLRRTARPNRTQTAASLSEAVKFEQGDYNADKTKETLQAWNPVLVPTGKLVGLTPDTITNPTNYVSRFSKDFFPNLSVPQLPTNTHLGGGMLGSQTYQHSNNKIRVAPDGFTSPRSWSKAVFSDALCRELPVIRAGDALPYVRPESSLPWAKGVSCQNCHVSMDGMAAANRNHVPVYTSDGKAGVFWYKIQNALPAEPLPLNGPDPDFSKRPASGVLMFRNYKGELVNLSVTGLNSLGAEIANQDDFYICVAKRMFEKLSGIEVPIQDPGAPSSAPPTPSQTYFRNLVVEFGLELKKDQSLPMLIRRIIQSPYFINPDRGRIE